MDDIEFITFVISATNYSGFTYKIPKNLVYNMSLADIINEVKIEMKNFFSNPHDLYLLKEGIDKLELHIHEELNLETKDIIYLCDHKNFNLKI